MDPRRGDSRRRGGAIRNLDLQSFQHDEAVMAGRVISRASGTRSASSTASEARRSTISVLGMVAAVLDERSTVLIVS